MSIKAKDVVLDHDEDNDCKGDALSPKQQRRVMRKIDIRVAVVCGILFFICLLDRTNLGFANIAGMEEELELGAGNRYNIIALVFFAPYVFFQLPSTFLVRRIGVHCCISTICVLWGVSMLGCGFVTSWHQLAGLRVLLGVFEAPFFPVTVYLLSTWYVRYEVQKRYAFFYLISCIASAFGGILAYGISQMAGLAGKAGWRWIFIIEALLTITIGIASFFVLVEFPENAHKSFHFLKPHEIQWVLQRIDDDRGDAQAEGLNISAFLNAGMDLKLWLLGIIFCCVCTITFGVSFFAPTILKEMGFSIAASQMLTAPPYVLAGALMVACGYIGDRYHIRGPLIILNAVISLVGAIIVAYCQASGVRYFGLFLLAAGSNANVPTGMAYQANNVHGQWARAFGSATIVGFGGIGGVCGSLVFRSQDAPNYVNGFYACMAASGLTIVIVLGFTAYFMQQNRLIRAGKKTIGGQQDLYYTL